MENVSKGINYDLFRDYFNLSARSLAKNYMKQKMKKENELVEEI